MRRGMGGHQGANAKTETWLTPPSIMEALGPFDLDPCAAPLPRPWPTARTHWALPETDGLAGKWFGRVWLNPPYGRAVGTWMRRLAEHGRGTALIFARTETDFFFESVWRRADALLFLAGRMRFHLPDGTVGRENGGAPSVLCAYGPDDAQRLVDSGLEGAVVGLSHPVLVHLAMKAPVHLAMKAPVHLAMKAPVEVESETWSAIVRRVVDRLGGRATLSEIYEALGSHPRTRRNVNWRAKVRQTVARAGLRRIETATYAA